MNDPSATVAAVDAQALETEALGAIGSAATADELEAARVRYLGRKSELKQALREVRDRETGMTLNASPVGRFSANSPTESTEISSSELLYGQDRNTRTSSSGSSTSSSTTANSARLSTPTVIRIIVG